MIKAEQLTFRYGKRLPYVLNGASFTLQDGEIGILMGKNGSGKTTLFQTLLGITTPESGTVSFDGEDLLRMKSRERARLIAYVPQHIHFGALSVYDSVLMGRISRFDMRPGQEDHAVVERILTEMGLEDFARRSAEELSGGEKQKIAIARALAQEPRMLIFDEPTGNLDAANEDLIIEEARKVAREKNITVLASLHDFNQALYFGDKFLFLRDGRVKYTGGAEIMTGEVIRDVFDIPARVLDVDGRKVILGGRQYEK